jgi:hypothetical protein
MMLRLLETGWQIVENCHRSLKDGLSGIQHEELLATLLITYQGSGYQPIADKKGRHSYDTHICKDPIFVRRSLYIGK